jgi:tellurite methyltransferase
MWYYLPMQVPENGFYYHYKHNEDKGFNHHAYEVTGIGKHTEDDSDFVIYRSLYVNDITPATHFVRPIELFFDEVQYEGKTLPHFVKITDPEMIEKLKDIKEKMYGSKKRWEEYYEITKNNPPSPLLVKALGYVSHKNKAIDIGGGALKDSRYLLEQGFEVTVIDKEIALKDHAASLHNTKLQYHVTSYDDFAFPENEYDIASAMFALPFNPPLTFDAMFDRVKKSLKPGGIFCGQFFGVHDEWNSAARAMTFHTKEEIQELLKDFEILSLREEEKDGTTANGTAKHWHIFHVIAKK